MPRPHRSAVPGTARLVLFGRPFLPGDRGRAWDPAWYRQVAHRTRYRATTESCPGTPEKATLMTRREAQEILLSCRPGREPANDPQVAAALELARTDPELHHWYEQHRAWDTAIRQKMRAIPVPGDLKYEILSGR